MPFYKYKHPETGEIFEDLRMITKCDEPFIADDGVECPRFVDWDNLRFSIMDKNEEVFQKDEEYTRLTNPKYIRFKDGHKEKYNPSKHIGGAGKKFDDSKLEEEVVLPKTGRPGQKIWKKGSWYSWNDDKKTWEKE